MKQLMDDDAVALCPFSPPPPRTNLVSSGSAFATTPKRRIDRHTCVSRAWTKLSGKARHDRSRRGMYLSAVRVEFEQPNGRVVGSGPLG